MLHKDEKFDLAAILRLGPILFVAMYGFFSFYALSTLQNTTQWVQHTQEVINAAVELEKLTIDLESGERGFLISGEPEFLEGYSSAKSLLFRRISETKGLVNDNREQVKQLEVVEGLVERWISEIAGPEIKLRQSVKNGETSALAFQSAIEQGQGKVILDRIRTYLNELNIMFTLSENYLANNLLLEISKNLVDQETGQRGFLLTGLENYLEPYHRGKKLLVRDIKSLHKLIDESYDRQYMMKNLKTLEAQALRWKVSVAEPEILIRRKQAGNQLGMQGLKDLVIDDRGKIILDGIRSISDEMNEQFVRSDNANGELALLSVMKALVDQETGLRGYLLTGEEIFLEPYIAGQKAFDYHASRLREVLSKAYSVPQARRLLDAITKEAVQWDARAGNFEIELRRAKDKNQTTISDVVMLISEGHGKALLDSIYNSIAHFIQTENNLMLERQNSADLMAVATLWVNAIGTFIIVLFAILVYRTNRRMHHGSLALENQQNKLEQQDWIKTNAASVTSNLTGITTIEEFSEILMNEMTPKVGAHVGVFYQVKEGREGKTVLNMAGSYAFNRRQNISNEISLGEGLVGQCALEKKHILLERAPDDYIQISSGTVEATPANIIVYPLLNEGALLGVVEFASAQPFNEAQRELISQTSGTLGIIINNITGRQKTEILLQDAQAMSEKLQVQQEELQAANETLEEQAQQLKASEEELNVSNEELLEKQDFLQVQKNQISLAKEELEKKAEDLQLASKYKTEFLANMSHELRTPLNSMLILSKMLTENKEGNLSDRQKEDIKVIHDGGKDLLVLINDIMDLSKVEAGMLSVHAEDVNVASVLNSMEGLFAHVSAEKMVDLYIDQDEEQPRLIYSDGQRIEQILKNFLSNAFKFTSEGSVGIKVHQPNSDVQFARDTLQHGSVIAFSVVDTGIGIPEGKQQAIFEAFQQEDGSTSRKYGGTGLGLSISKELAGLLGGEVSLSSEQGKGSTFTLYLPYSLPGVEAPEQSDSSSSRDLIPENQTDDIVDKPAVDATAFHAMEIFIDDDRRGTHEDDNAILIIEDDPVFAKLLLGIIRDKGYKGLVTNKGRDGLYLAMHYLPSGILLDVGLPDIDGMAVLDQLKFHLKTRDIPVHVISGRDNNNNEFLTGGAVSFLQKPIEASAVESILSGITETLEGQQKSVLLIEDDESSSKAIERLISSDKVKITACATGMDAKTLFKNDNFDCVILDLGLPDMSGYEILEYMADLPEEERSPVIVYTGQEISDDEQKTLTKYTNNVIIKGAESPERLLDDVSLFLHRVTADLSAKHLNVIGSLHNENAMLQGRKVLLVDDDMRNLFALSRQLEDMGLDVDVASNGEEAIEALNVIYESGGVGGYDLILMDIMMPIMDGYEAMGKIREMKPYKDIPIIALTAKAMQEDREKCISAGASEYLTKPIDVNKLVSILRIWLYKVAK